MSKSPKPTKAQQKAFARRFSPSTWFHLCGSAEFENAFSTDLELASVIAHRILEDL